MRAEVLKVVQTNGRLVHHSNDLLLLPLQLLDLVLLLLQLDSDLLQIIIQTHLIFSMIVI